MRRLLLDPQELAERPGSNVHLSLTDITPSPDGKFVAVGVVPSGSTNEMRTRIVSAFAGSIGEPATRSVTC